MALNEPGPPEWIGVRDVTLSFGHRAALSAIDFRLGPGEFHALVGNHNDGKSCLCRILAGTVRPDSGGIWVDGAARAPYGIREASALGVAYIGGSADIFPHLSVLENVVVGSYGTAGGLVASAPKSARDTAFLGWLAGFGLTVPGRMAAGLPYEDRLLIKVLGCLYKNPRLLILDETLEQFTLDRRTALLAELRRRKAAGMSVLWATHKLDEVLDLADRVSVVRNGRLYLSVDSGKIDRRSLIRMAYSSTKAHPGDGRDDFENYYNLIQYSEVLLENLPSAVMVMDETERIQFVNATGLEMFSLEKIYRSGMPAPEALAGRNPFLLGALRACLADRAGQSFNGAPFATGRGSVLVDVKVLAVSNAAGRPAVMLVLDDVSERENMRRQLTIAHNLSSIGMLAAGVAHEVNNPLESIGNYISYLMRRVESEEAGNILKELRKEAGYIRDIVTNLVMFSGKGDKRGRDVDLADGIRDIVRMLGFNSKYDDIEIECKFPDSRPVAVIDPNEFRQIILNLVRNAMEAMPGGGAVNIRVEDIGGTACRIEVRDHGPGLPPGFEHANDIFLPFNSSKNGDAEHQGLGLSIVYGLVRKWGGTIAAEAANPGTRFVVELPLSEQAKD